MKFIFTDQVEGTSIVGITADQGIADISVIAGQVYNVSTEFNGLNKSTEHMFYEPETVEVLVSADGTINSILFVPHQEP